MKNDVITLVYESTSRDADGFPIITRNEEEFWCDIQSVKRSEFYAAASSNIKVVLVAVMNYIDFDTFRTIKGKPSKVIYMGDDYNIVRTYRMQKKNDIELMLSEVE